MINIEKKYLSQIKRILLEIVPETQVRVFGSRIKGNCHKYSDLDLILTGKKRLSDEKIEALKDAFSESDLPFMVDLVDWNSISDEFREVLEKEGKGVPFCKKN